MIQCSSLKLAQGTVCSVAASCMENTPYSSTQQAAEVRVPSEANYFAVRSMGISSSDWLNRSY